MHHPESDILTAFSAGSLPLSQALCISTHLEYCEACRHSLKRLNRLGSELFQTLTPAPASETLRDKIMGRVGEDAEAVDTISESIGGEKPAAPIRPAEPRNSRVARSLQQFISDDYQSVKWQRVAKGIFNSEICRDVDGAKVELIKMKAGGSVLSHTHLGDELTVILEGSFSDEDGVYKCGDFVLRDARHEHKPVATLNQDCICLAVTNAPIQFTGFFSRWLNPLLRRSYA